MGSTDNDARYWRCGRHRTHFLQRSPSHNFLKRHGPAAHGAGLGAFQPLVQAGQVEVVAAAGQHFGVVLCVGIEAGGAHILIVLCRQCTGAALVSLAADSRLGRSALRAAAVAAAAAAAPFDVCNAPLVPSCSSREERSRHGRRRRGQAAASG